MSDRVHVEIGGVAVRAFEVQAIDGLLAVHVDPHDYTGACNYFAAPTDAGDIEVNGYETSGKIATVQVEEAQVTLWLDIEGSPEVFADV
jgi:hypothetical protein